MAQRADGGDLLKRFDADIVGALASDDRQKPSRADTANHANVCTALKSASGRFEAAVLHGERYTIANLDALDGTSKEYMKDIICTLGMVRLLRRRPGAYKELREELTTEEENHMKLLSTGVDVFDLDAHREAGLIDQTETTENYAINTRSLTIDKLRGHLVD